MSDIVRLRFIKRMEPYSVGDLAGFTLNHASGIVAAGRAVYDPPPPGCDEFGKAIKKEALVEKPKTKGKKKAPAGSMEKRKSGKLGTVKK